MKSVLLSCTLIGILISCNMQDNAGKARTENIEKVIATMNEFYLRNNYDSSIKYLDVLIAADSTNGEYFFKRGYSFSQIDRRDQAIADYKKAIQLHHRVSDSYLNIGLNYMYQNDSLALYYCKKSLEADPSNRKAAIQIEFCEKILNGRKRK
jgi:tetratricopeptide (TPR) repeat protein